MTVALNFIKKLQETTGKEPLRWVHELQQSLPATLTKVERASLMADSEKRFIK